MLGKSPNYIFNMRRRRISFEKMPLWFVLVEAALCLAITVLLHYFPWSVVGKFFDAVIHIHHWSEFGLIGVVDLFFIAYFCFIAVATPLVLTRFKLEIARRLWPY